MNKIIAFVMLNCLVLGVFAILTPKYSHAQCISSFPYAQDFEASAGGFVAGGNTSFAYGTPAGTTINAAASGTKAWKTNLTGLYNNNETGYVQSPCFNLSSFGASQIPMLSLKIWYNCEANWDNANIKYSTNNGSTWQVLGTTGTWYNKQGSTMFGPMMEDSWNDNSNGWRYVRQNLSALASQSNVIFRIYFSSDPIYPSGDGFAFDDFSIFDFSPVVDLALNGASNNQVSGCVLVGNAIISTVISNVGGATVSNFGVSYSVNGTAPVTETVTASIAPNASINYTFATPYTIGAPNTYNIVVTNSAANDINPNNNAASTFFVSSPNVTNYPYLENFENGSGGFFKGGYSSFTLSTPQPYYIFNAAASGTKIWTTAPTFPYFNDDRGYVQSPCFNFSNFSASSVPTLGLKVWYDCETAYDNANVKYSTNGGSTWQLLGSGVSAAWYNRLAGSISGPIAEDCWNGDGVQGSQGWLSKKQDLSFLKGQANVIFRIHFNADGIANVGDGFAFDDFSVYDNASFIDATTVKSSFPNISNCGLAGNVPLSITLKNTGATTLTNIPVSYKINGGVAVNEVFNTTLNPNDTATYVFTTQINVANNGVYRAEASANMPNDGDLTNNKAEAYINNSFLVSSFPYLENFEASNGNFYVASDSCSFEWGEPNSQALNTAASGTKAWKTRLTSNYSSNDRGFVQSPCFDMSAITNPKIGLKIYYGCETNWDNANIKYSTDGGITFRVLGGVSPTWYNTPRANVSGPMKQDSWSGNGMNGSPGWVAVSNFEPALAGKSSVIFRICFSSDGSTTPGGGFAFDDFSVTNLPTQLSPFVLRTPTASQLINVQGGGASTATISWQKTSSNTPQPITYTWLTDAVGGNFANPTFATGSNNAGSDTTLTFTYTALDSLLAARGLAVGDTLKLIHTVRATNGAISRFANAPFELQLRRGLLNVGLENIELSQGITISPNPSTELTHIVFATKPSQSMAVNITDAMGKTIFTQKYTSISSQKIPINTKNMAKGIYFIHINSGTQNATKKLVVQ